MIVVLNCQKYGQCLNGQKFLDHSSRVLSQCHCHHFPHGPHVIIFILVLIVLIVIVVLVVLIVLIARIVSDKVTYWAVWGKLKQPFYLTMWERKTSMLWKFGLKYVFLEIEYSFFVDRCSNFDSAVDVSLHWHKCFLLKRDPEERRIFVVRPLNSEGYYKWVNISHFYHQNSVQGPKIGQMFQRMHIRSSK